jgi:membrane fusion protein (multidrug efflux system)
MHKKNLILAIMLLFCCGFASKILAKQNDARQKHQMPPIVVETAQAQSKIWQDSISSTGTISAFNGIKLSPEIPGRITKIYFKSGQSVEQDAPLIQIYPDVIKAQFEKAQAQLKLSTLEYERNLKLYKKKFVSKEELDKLKANLDSATAEVNLQNAQLKQYLLTAPFSGKLGLRKVSLGDYVNPGEDLVSLQSVDSMLVDFSVPQVYQGEIQAGDQVAITSDALPKIYNGKISAIDSIVDPNTRMIGIQATVPNYDNILVPGTFVEVQIKIKHAYPVIVIPTTALVYSTSDNYVFRMIDHKAVKTNVTLGKMLKNNQIIITQGLHDGDTVIIGGQVKLFDGSPVLTEQEYQKAATQILNKK